MAAFDIKSDPNVKVITETNYRGIKSIWVDGGGWKICLGSEEYLFPTWQDAKYAIDKIHEDCVKKYGAVKLKVKTTNE